VRLGFIQPYLFSPKVSLTFSGQGWFSDEPAFTLDTLGGRSTIAYELTQRNPVSGRGGASTISVSFIGERENYTIAPEFLADLSFRDDLIALGLDPRTGIGNGFLGAIAVDYRRGTTGNILDARRGYTVAAHAERAGGFLPGDFDYHEYTLEGRHYQTMGRLGVLATRARIGTIDGAGTDEACSSPNLAEVKCSVPFFKRYFPARLGTLRGL
jgi:hypothetical protein